MAKLIALPSATFEGKVWVNPDGVSCLLPNGEAGTVLQMIGQQMSVYVRSEPDEVAAKLNSVRQREPV